MPAGVSYHQPAICGLLGHYPLRRRHRAGGRGFRDREGQPGIPARRPVFGGEFAISLQAEECLIISDREDVSDLRAEAQHARTEAAQNRILTKIVSDLLVGITDEADEQLFRQEVRRAPVEMEVDAALIICIRIDEVVGAAAY